LNKTTFVFLLLLSVQAWAQTPIIKDADGKLVGYPISIDVSLEDVVVVRPDELLIELWMPTGELDGSPWYPSFESTDCSGPALTDPGYFEDVTNKKIELGHCIDSPCPVLLIQRTVEPREFTVHSYRYPSGCGTDVEGSIGLYVSQDILKIEDPTQYGLILLPEINEWGYKGPLSVGLSNSDLISCSGFESCPTP
jgi:hypothetical protein